MASTSSNAYFRQEARRRFLDSVAEIAPIALKKLAGEPLKAFEGV